MRLWLWLVVLALLTPCATAQSPGETRVDAADLALSPGKYAGKDLMVMNMRCYFAGDGDYRCMAVETAPVLAVFTKTLTDDTVRQQIEDGCDAIKTALTSRKCLVILRFRYTEDELDEDVLSGYEQRVILRPRTARATYFLGYGRPR